MQHFCVTTSITRGDAMESAAELHGRSRLALSILNHKEECGQCHEADQKAVAALEGVPYDVLVREAG